MSRRTAPGRRAGFQPSLEQVEARDVPAAGFRAIPDDAVAVGPDDGGIPRVNILDPVTGEDVAEVQAYEDAFRGGVRTALGDITGDGVRDLVIAPGVGGGPRIRIVDGSTGDTLRDFFVYEASFTGGLSVALGDVNGDGKDDIITGTGNGGGPRVRVLDGAALGATVLRDFFAYEGTFRGGVLVAAGDVDGDGRDDVITGTGVGGGPRVLAFDGDDGRTLRNFFAYDDSFRGGVLVAAGDLDGDGTDDIVTGTGPGGGPRVRGFDDRGRELIQFLADDSSFRGGVGVGSDDVNGDGRDDILSRTRRGNAVVLRVTDPATGAELRSFVRVVDDNPGGGSGGGNNETTVAQYEGTITAVDAAAGTVSIRLQNGQTVVVRTGPGTKVERNEITTSLAGLVVGERGEAKIGPDGIAWKVEGGFDISGRGGDDTGGGGGGGSGDPVPATSGRFEGTITGVDTAAGAVTIRLQNGQLVLIRTSPGTEIERDDIHVALSAFRVGDRGEARVGADGVAAKVEAETV
ncbi:MAG: FG-GAP-like repeat-containing protein [Gemmataceae bacterium]|nr:FG-GAP-like repeat-containing protein [Gemmataceae bacterium]